MLRIPSAFLLLLVPATLALATGPNSFRPRVVDWNDTLFVPAYPAGDPVPQAVVLRYQRWTSASGRVENMEGSPCGVVFTHYVQMELSLSGGRVLDVANRIGEDTCLLGAYDGIEDFGGESGRSLWSSAGETTTLVLLDPADIAFFAGSEGVVPLQIVATGEAAFWGPESLQQDVEQRAGVRLTVEYVPAQDP